MGAVTNIDQEALQEIVANTVKQTIELVRKELDTEPLRTKKQAAAYFAISETTLEHMMDAGIVEYVRIGRSRRFSMEHLREGLERIANGATFKHVYDSKFSKYN